jgi:hypothetical protein
LKQTLSEEYENPQPTVESFTRSQNNQISMSHKEENEKEKLTLKGGSQLVYKNSNCKC